MKRLIVLLLLMPSMALCENLSFNFRNIPVITFAEATYRSVLGKNYILSPEVVALDTKVTLSLKNIDRAKLPKVLEDVLASAGVQVHEQDGIVRFERIQRIEQSISAADDAKAARQPQDAASNEIQALKQEEIDYEVYRPVNRPVEYLQAALRFSGLSQGGMPQGQGQQVYQDTLIIAGTEEKRQKIRKLLADLDVRPHVLNIRAALVEYSDTKNDSLSIGGVIGALTGRLSVTLDGSNRTTNFARLKTESLDVVLGAMAGDSRFRFRTEPSLRLVDGETGRLQVGSDVPIRGAVSIGQGGQVLQSTEYRPSGLVLTISPKVLRDRIQARIVQEVSSFAQTTTSNIDSPTLNKRQLEAVVDAEDGEIVVLGGLDEESNSDGRAGLFSWLPLTTSNSNRKTQLVLLLELKRL